MKFFVVDDDQIIVTLVTRILEAKGHEVASTTDSTTALERMLAERPDCLLVDLMMPEVDGFELVRRVKAHPDLSDVRIVVVSSKTYEFDRKRAFDAGAEGYITKPFDADAFLDEVEALLHDGIELRFWGVRGTLPVPGEKSLRYGGNTNCVTVELSRERFFIFDAGSGIKALSDHLVASGRVPFTANLFISHPHWDHINALPFFVPLYMQGGEFAIHGAKHGDVTTREMISAQMDGVYFPITIKEFASRVYFKDLGEETFEVDGVTIKTKLLNHPGNCLGYRLEHRGKSVCYITDNELFLPDHPAYNERYEEHLAEFVGGTDALIIDTTYTDEEYASKVNWGHSAVSRVVELAHRAKTKTLYLYHHDPDQDDDAIDAKLETARKQLAELGSETRVVAPAEGDVVHL